MPPMANVLTGFYRRVARSWYRNGWRHVLGTAVSLPLLRLRQGTAPAGAQQAKGGDFDRRFNVDTADGLGQVNELRAIDSPAWNHGFLYEPTREDHFHDAMTALPARHEEFTFIDLGSGKGKALLMASDWPFRRIVGVEYCRPLHEVALRNIRNYRHPSMKCPRIESIHGDAAAFELPLGPCVVYMYNPFDHAIMDKVAANLADCCRRDPRPLFIVYYNPLHVDPLLRHGFEVAQTVGAGQTLILQPG